ncbi:MAG: hypothetical protein AAGE52_26790, partial [Myxococcota bacterium]
MAPTADLGGTGTFDILAGPSDAYGSGPVLEALDVVATALVNGRTRTDIQSLRHGDEILVFDEARELADAGHLFARSHVEMRAQNCVGKPIEGGVDRVRLRLFGPSRNDTESFSVWIGEAGLQCATTGSVEGIPCDPTSHRVQGSFQVRSDGERSGFGSDYLEFVVARDGLPEGMSAVPEEHFYVAQDGPSGRDLVVGLDTTSGPSTGEWSRCTTSPAGIAALANATAVLATSPRDCSTPLTDCAGLPFDQEVPLEDEIAEARGRLHTDDLETSWEYALRSAREAATVADILGQELVARGLEFDLRLEAAAEAVGQICGVTIPVSHVPGSTGCANNDDCGDGYRCGHGACFPNDVSAYLPEGADSDALQNCLDPGEETIVSFGTRDYCVWRKNGGPPCAADEIPESLGTQCPWVSEGNCNVPGDALALGFEGMETFPLELFQEVGVPGAGEVCNDLAHIVRNAPVFIDSTEVANVVNSSWLNQAPIDDIAQHLKWTDGPLEFSGIRSVDASRGFASLGSFFYGPNDEWPCAPHPSIDTSLCDSADPTTRPLGCGYDCTQLGGSIGRMTAANDLRRAVSTMDALVGREFGHNPFTYQFAHSEWTHGRTHYGSVSLPEFSHLNDPTLCTLFPPHTPCAFPSDASFDAQLVGHSARPNVFSLLIPGLAGVDLHTNGDYYPIHPNIRYGINSWMFFRPGEFRDAWDEDEERFVATTVPWTGVGDPNLMNTTNYSVAFPLQDMWAGSGRAIDAFVALYGHGFAVPTARVDIADWNRPAGSLLDIASSGLPAHVERVFGEFEAPPLISDDSNVFADEEPTDANPPGTLYAPRPLAGGPMTYRDYMRGLELACYAVNSNGSGLSCGEAVVPPSLNTVEDLDSLASFAECQAKSFRRRAGTVFLTGVPANLAENLRDNMISSTYPAYQGAMGEAMGILQSSLESLPPAVADIENGLRDIGLAVSQAASRVRELGIQDRIAQLDFLHSSVGHATSCAAATAQAASVSGVLGGGPAAAAVTCAGGVAQTIIEGKIAALQSDALDEQTEQVLIEAVQRMLEAIDRMSGGEAAFRSAIGQVNAQLARVAELRRQAMVQLSKVLVYEEGVVGEGEYPVNSVMRTRLATARIRYERALQNARQLAWIAKRSIEQRFGVELEAMNQDMALVEAPRRWARQVCSMGGINYPTIRGELEGPIEDYADDFIGRYVKYLELFVESYRLDFPTENGSDIAVVSLRDDVLRSSTACDAESYNQLIDSASMSFRWRTSCVSGQRCTNIAQGVGGPFRGRVDAFGNPEPRRLGEADTLLLSSACKEEDIDDTTGNCTNTHDSQPIEQALNLEGHYLLSWYEPVTPVDDCNALCCETSACDQACWDACEDSCAAVHPVVDSTTMLPHVPKVEVSVLGDGTSDPVTVGTPTFLPATDRWLQACSWRRVFMDIHVPARQHVRIGFRRPAGVAEFNDAFLVPHEFAAPQLESLSTTEAASSLPPRRFFPSDEDRTMQMAVCPDLNGDVFRSLQHWRRGCQQLCPEGFEDACADGSVDRAVTRCFWETNFHISQDAIDRGDLFPNGGFASGNFNYRHNTIGVNLVGVGVRDCATADNPGACYASGSLPFSIRHDGPYLVRNHDGDDVEAPLYVGNIQHGRALAAERYLTNPLSGADRGLMT